jgi:tetratricopeptide (TPR) repeat protein
MDEEQEELSTHEASQRSGLSQGHLASLLRQHKLEGSYNSKQRRWMVNAAALERYLTIDDKTGERSYNYAQRLYQRAQQAVQEGHLVRAEPLYQKAITLFDEVLGEGCVESRRMRNNLGRLYYEQQRYTEAETLFLRALNCERGVNDVFVVSALLSNISHLYMAQDRFAEAEPYMHRQRRLVADCMRKMLYQMGRARLFMDQQRYFEAEELLVDAEYYLEYDDTIDSSAKLAFYLTWLRVAVLQEKHQDVHRLLKKVQLFMFPEEAEEVVSDALFLHRLAERFRKMCRYEEAEPLYCYAIKLFERENEDAVTRMMMGLALNCLAQLYHEQENYREAEATYLRALSVLESVLGIAHPEVVPIFHNLADLAVDQGNYRDALSLLERARSAERKAPELDDRSAATMLYDDGHHLLEQGQLAEAEALLRRALILDEEQGPGDQEVIDDLTLLAHVLFEQGKFSEADLLARRALTLEEERAEDPGAAIVIQLHLLGLIAQAQGKEQEARALQQRVATCSVLGPRSDDINALFAFHEDARDIVVQGHYAEAETLVRHTLIVHEQVLGKEHRHVVLYLNQLAEIYCLQGKYHLAEPLLLRILTLTKQAGSDLPLLAAISLYQLAQFSLAQADITRAGRLAEQAYREVEQAVGSDHVVAGIVLTTKAHTLFLLEKKEEAEEIAQQAYSLLVRGQTAESPFQLCAAQTLAQVYNDMGQHEKAEPFARRTLREAELLLVFDHPLLMFLLHTLAAALAGQKKYQEAEALYQRALMIAEQVFEPTHNFMLTLLKGLGLVYQEQEQYAFAELTFKQLLEIVEQRDDQHPLRVSLLYQQIGLTCILQGKTEEGRQYIERSTSLVGGDIASHSPQKDSLSFLQEAMMDGSRKKEI